jgi:phosphatidate cytidylyltransferase
MTNNELEKRIFSSIILLPLVYLFISNGSFYFNFFIIICFIVSIYEWWKMIKKIYLRYLGSFFLFFSFYTFYKISIDQIGIFILFTCISTDIGGFVFGKFFKGPKLTKISPNKTYSGMIGSYFLSIIFLIFFTNFMNYQIDIKWIILTILISTISQVGDIILSYFKRLSKIKDTGKIIPGHGGLLDRIDGMIFAFPFFYLININNFYLI